MAKLTPKPNLPPMPDVVIECEASHNDTIFVKDGRRDFTRSAQGDNPAGEFFDGCYIKITEGGSHNYEFVVLDGPKVDDLITALQYWRALHPHDD